MMIILSPSAWRRVVFVGLLMSCAPVVPTAAVYAQTFGNGGQNPAVATDGATLIHGNYCGAGNRPGKPPIDALDLACMNHDACSPTGGMPTCECNARLRAEAFAVSQDRRQTPELRSLASLTAAAAAVMMCNPMTRDAVIPAPAAEPPMAPVVQAPLAPLQAPPAAGAQGLAATTPVAPPPVVQPPVAAPPVAAPMSIVPAGAAPPSADPAPADDDSN
jgi:hypothetical protein